MSKSNIVIALVLATCLHTSVSQAQGADTAQTFLEFQVERPVRVKAVTSPVYPDRLRAGRVEGQVIVQFVVGEDGTAQMNTFKTLKSTDNAFTESVKRAVRSSLFFPAEIGGRKVRQLVQQPFLFAPSR
jgi:protein TonB